MTDHVDVPVVANGDWIDAAWINQYIGDNNRAWQQAYTAAGMMAYALDSNTLAGLAAPAGLSLFQHNGSVPSYFAAGSNALKFLRVNAAGNALEWASNGISVRYVKATNLTTTNSITGTDIINLWGTITLAQQSQILLFMWAPVNASIGDTPTQAAMILGDIGGVAQTWDASTPKSYIQAYNPISNFQLRTGVPAGNVVCKVKVATTDTSRQCSASGGIMLALAIPE